MKKIIFAVQLMLIACFSYAGSFPQNFYENTVSKTFVFVHGAWQGPYVWQEVKAQLEKKGNKVIVVELPAHGNDATPAVKTSMDMYRDKVIEAINETKGKVILVGHSMGGMVISAVAEKIPGQIEKLVFIGAFVPANGQSLLDLSYQDKQSILGPAIVPSADQLTMDIKPGSVANVFFQDAPEKMKKMMADNFRVEPAIPFTNKVTITKENFGSVDKYYLYTLEDHAIGIDMQKKMVSDANITKISAVDTGHSPFLSKPSDVVKYLLEISR